MNVSRQKVYIIFIVLTSFIGVSLTQKIFKSIKRNTFYIEPEKKFNWFQASAECTRLNMTLLTIETAEKNNEVSQLLRDVYKDQTQPPLYIGGQDLASFRKFLWITNAKPFEYTNWEADALTDRSSIDNHCVYIGSKGSQKLNIANCKRLYGFICEHSRKLV